MCVIVSVMTIDASMALTGMTLGGWCWAAVLPQEGWECSTVGPPPRAPIILATCLVFQFVTQNGVHIYPQPPCSPLPVSHFFSNTKQLGFPFSA